MAPVEFCEHCGASVAAPARFCSECGVELAESVPVTPMAAMTASSAPPPSHRDSGTAPTPGPAVSSLSPPSPSPAARPSLISSTAGSSLPIISELPLELWLVIGAFALPGAWIVFEVIKGLPDAIKLFGAQFYGFRLGLALMLILLMVGLLGVAMLAIAWRLYHRDRVGRGLAYAFAGTIIISVLLSSNRTGWETGAMIFSIAGIAILALAPRVRALFDPTATPGAVPTSVIVSRTLIAVFSALAIFIAVIYLLLASISGKYAVAALVAGTAAALASHWSKRLNDADRTARQALSIGGLVVVVLLIVLGRASTGLLIPLGLIVAAIGSLWIPNDARAFFGDDPIRTWAQ